MKDSGGIEPCKASVLWLVPPLCHYFRDVSVLVLFYFLSIVSSKYPVAENNRFLQWKVLLGWTLSTDPRALLSWQSVRCLSYLWQPLGSAGQNLAAKFISHNASYLKVRLKYFGFP